MSESNPPEPRSAFLREQSHPEPFPSQPPTHPHAGPAYWRVPRNEPPQHEPPPHPAPPHAKSDPHPPASLSAPEQPARRCSRPTEPFRDRPWFSPDCSKAHRFSEEAGLVDVQIGPSRTASTYRKFRGVSEPSRLVFAVNQSVFGLLLKYQPTAIGWLPFLPTFSLPHVSEP